MISPIEQGQQQSTAMRIADTLDDYAQAHLVHHNIQFRSQNPPNIFPNYHPERVRELAHLAQV